MEYLLAILFSFVLISVPFWCIIIIGYVDELLKKLWNLPNGKWSKPASILSAIITAIEFCIGLILYILAFESKNFTPYIINVIVYIIVIVLVYWNRYCRLVRQRRTGIKNSVEHYLFSDDSEYKSNILEDIDAMDGHLFEYYCADVLRKNGYTQVAVTKGSGDQGVDIIAVKDSIRYAIQCKNYASPLGNKPVQEVTAGKFFYNCHVGVVMTNSTFTTGAQELAQATGVLLWDRNKLIEFINNS